MNGLNMEQYQQLLPIAARLYEQNLATAYKLLAPLFLVSLATAFTRDLGLSGAIVSRLRPLVVTAFLLLLFPYICSAAHSVGLGIAQSIDNMQGLDTFLDAAAKKAGKFSLIKDSLLNLGNDILVSAVMILSYILLFFARYFILAFYHFYWLFLLVLAPFLILGNLFEATSGMTKTLFKNILTVACWPIVWAVLSAFLRGIPFASAYATEGGYTTIIVMNLIIAVSLLLSPLLVSQFAEGAVLATGPAINSMIFRVAQAAVPKVRAAGAIAQGTVSQAAQMRNKWISRGTKLSLLLLCLNSARAEDAKPARINLLPGFSCLIEFSERPSEVVLGDSKNFQVERIGTSLVARSLKRDAKSNLFAIFPSRPAYVVELFSDLGSPHTYVLPSGYPPLAIKEAVSGARAVSEQRSGVLRVQRSKLGDYLNIEVRVANDSATPFRPTWAETRLVFGKNRVRASKVWAQRQSVEPGTKILARFEFVKPGLPPGEPSARISIPNGAGPPLQFSLKEVR